MKAVKLTSHYQDDVAANYEEGRMHQKKWQLEDQTVAKFFADLPKNMSVVDVPAGTGRFFPQYIENGHTVHAIDISDDMLTIAREKAETMDPAPVIKVGDIMDMDYPDDAFDLSLCMRLMNLLSPAGFRSAMKELARVSKGHIIVGVRHDAGFIRAWYKPAGLMQAVRRARLHMKGKIVIQSYTEFESLLQKYALTIQDKVEIEKRADGSEYYIYLLRKSHDS